MLKRAFLPLITSTLYTHDLHYTCSSRHQKSYHLNSHHRKCWYSLVMSFWYKYAESHAAFMFYQGTVPPSRWVLLPCTYRLRTTKGYYLLQHLISIKLTLMLVPLSVRAPVSGWVVAKKDPVFMGSETDYPQPAGQTDRQDRHTSRWLQ